MEEEKENPRRGPGKFDSDLDAALYSLSLDGGPDEQIGEAQDFGWYGLMKGVKKEEVLQGAKDSGDDLSEEEAAEIEDYAGVIIHEDSQGLVSVGYYEDEKKLERDWKRIEEDAEEFYAESE